VAEPVLRLDGVWRGFVRGRDRVAVLRDVSLSVDTGSLVAVLGERGQGKTTLIRVASGTLPAEDGEVLIDGQNMHGISDGGLSDVLARKIGVATRIGPGANLDVESYLGLRLNAACTPRRTRKAEVKRTLRDFDLAGTEKMLWPDLSDWQRVALELAQATVVKPRLLLVDDILDGLAFGPKDAALEILETLAEDQECAVLMAVSDHTTATRGDPVHHLANGKLHLMHPDPKIINLETHREQTG
jgi:putative ABC transport system ATP-binding protein